MPKIIVATKGNMVFPPIEGSDMGNVKVEKVESSLKPTMARKSLTRYVLES